MSNSISTGRMMLGFFAGMFYWVSMDSVLQAQAHWGWFLLLVGLFCVLMPLLDRVTRPPQPDYLLAICKGCTQKMGQLQITEVWCTTCQQERDNASKQNFVN